MSNDTVTKEGDIVLMHGTAYLVIKDLKEETSLRLLNLTNCTIEYNDIGYYTSGNILDKKINLGKIMFDMVFDNKFTDI